MGFQETLQQTEEYKTLTGNQDEGSAGTAPEQAATLAQATAPVIRLEKNDLQFWMNVATVILLFLIYRELADGGA